MKSLINSILDKSIYYSFDKTGFDRHSKEYFTPLMAKDLGRVLITGGTTGIGEALSRSLNPTQTIVTGRNKSKYTPTSNSEFIQLDLCDWDEIEQFAHQCKEIDHLVLNAGAMPEVYRTNDYGVETQCASQLLGHLILFKALHQNGKLKKNSKVIITSSGGMLLKKLDVLNLFTNSKYDKVSTYANVKRAQVLLVKYLALKFPQYLFASMHPGWVETIAVKEALPSFHKKMQNRLRSSHEGADTIHYLLKTPFDSGQFWFDRKVSKEHLTPFTKTSKPDRESLEDIFEKILSTPLELLKKQNYFSKL